MKLLVLGASGFVGRHLLRLAKDEGYDAVGTQSAARGGELVPFDLTSDRLADRFPRAWFAGEPVVVVVAAAIPSPDRCRTEREQAFAVNVTGAIRALTDAAELGAVPVFLSSSFVFDGERGGYGDRDPRSPISEYGRQKTEVELFVERELSNGLTLRLDKTVGDDPGEHHLLSEWWNLARHGREIRCIAGQDFSVTLVDDVARGVLLASARRLTGTYNLATPEHSTRIELARRFLAAAGLSAPVVDLPERTFGFADRRALRSWLDASALTRAIELKFTSIDRLCASFLTKAADA